MVEQVVALVLEISAERRHGSSPCTGTNTPVVKLVVRAGLKTQWTVVSVSVRV